MAETDDNRTIHLVSQEGECFDVPLSVGRMSELVKTMIDEDQTEEEAQEIPLPNVKSAILAKVIEFTKHYKEEPMNEIEKVAAVLFVFFLLHSSNLPTYAFLCLAPEISKHGRGCSGMVL